MKALLVIDMQKALFAAGNRYDAAGVISRINSLIERARAKNLPLIFIRHNSEDDGLQQNSDGWQILDELDFRPGDLIMEKSNCDSFCQTELSQMLDEINVKELIITGCCTDFCIDTTVRQAASMGYKVHVASDAHTTASKPYLDAETIIKHHNFVWSELYAPILVRVEPTATILNEL
ncbi:cysteine hydrolase family protein [Maridesulfovibrio salexigens]|uniref:Isochorismatase hydrolase n=1 Tax=Maridesulfovibrio salexigens (strain ATCC 14822 / DSM 2638 / NCIMB 8403 / VKM B-1763) TaxID=526222 RepID=C6BZI7_MARSD|nr:cysteine hydrolase family protein [Maridesulfovibrio salexigens]ACS80824.1 isochorismatase hydrolase [Maridesulfovibrio salexigens DSM 2638]